MDHFYNYKKSLLIKSIGIQFYFISNLLALDLSAHRNKIGIQFCIFTGKDRSVRLLPVAALDPRKESKWIKVGDTKNCHAICAGAASIPAGAAADVYYFCVAVKKSVS